METDNVPVQYMLVPEEDQVKVENTKQILVIEDDVVDLWHTVGATQGLSSDVDICRFLLSLYVSRGPSAPQYGSRCSHCNAVLTPICINCNLPSRPSSQQSPPARQVQSTQGPRHQTQQDPILQPSATSARPASPEDSGGWHLPENDGDDSDGAGGLDMEVYGDDAGDVLDVEMERPKGKGPKQGKKQVLAKVSYPKIPSKMLKKRKGSRVTVAAKRKSKRGSPASSKTSTKTSDSSGTAAGGEGKDTDHTCTKCDIKFMSKRALSSHMNRSSCKSTPLQSTADAQASAAASDPSQQDASHPEAETSKEKESAQEQNGGNKTADTGENSMQSKDGDEEIHEAEVAVASSSGSAAPGICHLCGKSFGLHKHLKRHIKNVHCQGEPVVCPEPGCRKSFLRLELLESHQKNKHSDEKPFKCQTCVKKFAMRKALTQHSHSCGGQKPYACNLCAMYFSSRSSLAEHKRRSHEGRQFVCGACSKVFQWKGSLKRHNNKCPSAKKPFEVISSTEMCSFF